MDAAAKEDQILESLEALSNEGLRRANKRISSLLTSRANEGRRQAAAEIKRLAKEHGLDVAVKQTGRKRGRPRKNAVPLP